MSNEIYDTNSANNQQNWVQRNSEWLFPVGSAAAQIGYNIYANQQNNKFNAKQAELNRQFNAEEAEKARQYETQMSNTAVTRAMQDYKNAGMNPHLATGGGPASTPSGSAASGSAATTAGMMPMDVGTAMNTALIKAQIDNMNANTQQVKLNNKWIDPKTKSEIRNLDAKSALTEKQMDFAKKEWDILSEEDQIRQMTFQKRFEAAAHSADAKKKQAEITSEWIHTKYGESMYKQGLTLGQIGQIINPITNAAIAGAGANEKAYWNGYNTGWQQGAQ